MPKKTGLGKGLGALLGEVAAAEDAQLQPLQTLPLQKIEPNPLQPRKKFDEEELETLADSIRTHGVIQPLTVRLMPSGYYQIIAGERRWRASRMAGLSEVPVSIIEADDKTAMELALVENLQRSDLDPIEEAMGYRQLMTEYDMTQEQAAERVGKSRPAVANALRLLNLCESVQQMVESGRLSAGHGRAIAALKNEAQQMAVAEKAANLSLSVRQTEQLCKKMAKPSKPVEEKPFGVDYLAECEKDLSKRLGRGVKIVSGKRKGRVELEYYGEEDLQALFDALSTLRRKEK
ncbi:MAG: ParB/RepB/Spo0J family partition protein [Clostridia bacterium]|nr:ParB/RepB/Spo0J family partition protein [Clostridia bacterium]